MHQVQMSVWPSRIYVLYSSLVSSHLVYLDGVHDKSSTAKTIDLAYLSISRDSSVVDCIATHCLVLSCLVLTTTIMSTSIPYTHTQAQVQTQVQAQTQAQTMPVSTTAPNGPTAEAPTTMEPPGQQSSRRHTRSRSGTCMSIAIDV